MAGSDCIDIGLDRFQYNQPEVVMAARLTVIIAAVLACTASQQGQGQAVEPPFGLGEYAVGHQRLDLPSPALDADVWYPVDTRTQLAISRPTRCG
jgi:hypothetical protein